MHRLRAIAQIALWAVLLAAFLCTSAPKILGHVSRGSVLPRGDLSFHSSDTFFQFAAGSSETSRRLTEFFESASAEKRVLILERDDDPASSLLGMLTAYVSWPRPVELVDVGRTRVSPISTTTRDLSPPAAIVVCRAARPAELPEGRHFGRGLEVIPIALNKP